METIGFIQWCLAHLNYWTITLLMAIESSFIPFPSEVVIPPAAFKAASNELNIYLVILFGTLGSVIGAYINYFFARFLGRPIIYRFAESKYGRMLLLSQEKLLKSEEYFDQRGAISTLIGRLIPAVRQLISIPAGLARMNFLTFTLCTAIGAGLWNAILALLGYFGPLWFGINNEQDLIKVITTYSHEIGLVIIGIVIIIIVYFIFKKKLKK